jgi:hypothetical protein
VSYRAEFQPEIQVEISFGGDAALRFGGRVEKAQYPCNRPVVFDLLQSTEHSKAMQFRA